MIYMCRFLILSKVNVMYRIGRRFMNEAVIRKRAFLSNLPRSEYGGSFRISGVVWMAFSVEYPLCLSNASKSFIVILMSLS